MHLAYDLDAGALYVKFSDPAVVATVELDENTMVDIAPGGALAGIEVLDYSKPWALETILAGFQVSEDDAAILRAVHAAESKAAELTVA